MQNDKFSRVMFSSIQNVEFIFSEKNDGPKPNFVNLPFLVPSKICHFGFFDKKYLTKKFIALMKAL